MFTAVDVPLETVASCYKCLTYVRVHILLTGSTAVKAHNTMI